MNDALQAARTVWEDADSRRSSGSYDADAIPEVWAAYKEWRAENPDAYPYNADIEKWIVEKYGVREELADHLGTQVYLAQQQNRREKEAARDTEMAADGFMPIKWDTEYRGEVHVRARKETDFMSSNVSEYGKFVDGGNGGGFFIPKGRRTRGFTLQSLKGYYKPIA